MKKSTEFHRVYSFPQLISTTGHISYTFQIKLLFMIKIYNKIIQLNIAYSSMV